MKPKICSGSTLACLAVALLSANGYGSEAIADGAITLQRISEEPIRNEQSATLQWTANGTAAAWLRLHRPAPNVRNDQTQEEIWAVRIGGPALTPAPVTKKQETASQIKLNGASGPIGSISPQLEVSKESREADKNPSASITPSESYLLISAGEITSAIQNTQSQDHGNSKERGPNPALLQGFLWSHDNSSILFIARHSLIWFELASRQTRTLLSGEKELTDVSISPDGESVSFVRDHSLFIVPSSGGAEKLISTLGNEDLLEGEPDWAYRNEWHMKRAYWWSPDSSQIAYLEIDDKAVAKYPIRSSDGEAREISYPKPSGALPIVHLYVRLLSDANPLEIPIPPLEIPRPLPPNATPETYKGSYIPIVAWSSNSRKLAIERLDRRQQQLELLLADVATGKLTSILTEKDPYWINVSNILYFLKNGKQFIWSSEKQGGHRHLYLYDLEGKQITPLTTGDWDVSSLDAVDEALGVAYFTGTEKSPMQRQLYQVKLDGTGFKQLTSEAGTHEAHFAPGASAYLDIFSSVTTPPRSIVTFLKGPADAANEATNAAGMKQTTQTADGPGSPDQPKLGFKLQSVDWIDIRLHQGGKTHAMMIRPPGFVATAKYPVIVYFAGGPGEQVVRDVWGGPVELWLQSMSQRGFIIFALDNQGTGGRGHYFEEPIHLRLGAQEMTDQRDGVRYLTSLPYVDASRIGVYGWGYGGFLVVHGMLDRPLIFKAGYAGAPVTDWRFYDAVFGERYLDDASVHADGWKASTALENARFLKGTLRIAQGTDDQLVHMENTLTLQHSLLNSAKAAEMLLLPDCGHEIEDVPARALLFTNMTDFFVKNL